MDISDYFQDTHWHVTISAGLWKSLPPTNRAGAQGLIVTQKVEFELEGGSRAETRIIEWMDKFHLRAYERADL